jgi:hypothetical protein
MSAFDNGRNLAITFKNGLPFGAARFRQFDFVEMLNRN